MQRRILIALMLVAFANAAARADECDKGPFSDFLFAMGDKLDCYFTIEMWEQRGNHASCFKHAKIRDDKPASIEALAAKLTRDVPGITVTRDPENPRILNLIDAGLPQEAGYALERRASIDFVGPLDSLPDAIGKTMWYAVRLSFNVGFENNVVSMATVHAERKSVRQILTGAVPLKNYGRVLWIARTRIYRDGHPGTEITFMDPKLNSAVGKNEGAIVEVSLPADCTLGRPIPLTVMVRNDGDKPFYDTWIGGLPNHKMEMELINRDTNQPVKMTENGQRTIESVGLLGDSVDMGLLEKDKSITSRIDLAEFYDPPPGRYRLTTKLHFDRKPFDLSFPVSVGPTDFAVAK